MGTTVGRPLSKLALVLLVFFFGTLGVHRFYLKQYGIALLYPLFLWTSLPAIAALVELIIFLFRREEALQAQYPDTASTGMVVLFAVLATVLAAAAYGIVLALMGLSLHDVGRGLGELRM